ncbi:MAG: hypothetical protein ACT4P1_02055 [Sporichthyaceae bacterium]
MSHIPTRTALAGALAAAVLATGAGALAPTAGADVTAPTAPRLLAIKHLPTEPPFSSWKATPVAAMDDQWLCEEEALPRGDTLWRTFYNTKAGTALTQYAVRMPSKKAARKAAARVKECFTRTSLATRLLPDDLRNLRLDTFLTSGLKDGLTVGAVTVRLSGPDEQYLWSVGRDGKYLSLLVFPLLSNAEAPADAWSAVSKKALRRVAR